MRTAYLDREDGQALAIIALAIAVLLGAAALAVDWGFGYTSRRELQNDADMAALTAGRRLASTFQLVASSPSGLAPSFGANTDDVCEEIATALAAAARSPRATIEISFFGDANADKPATWTVVSTADCRANAGSVPQDPPTVFVRARASATYASLLNVFNRGPITVAASARVRLTAGAAARPLQPDVAARVPGPGLSGSTTRPNATIWPFMIHFNANSFASDKVCGRFCDEPDRLISLWDKGTAADNGTVLVTFAHESVKQPVHQLVSESDYTGAVLNEGRQLTGLLDNYSSTSSCSIVSGKWDTMGVADPRTCDVPNWFHYGYRGSVSLGTDWASESWKSFAGGQTAAGLPAGRESCAIARARTYFPTFSCAGPTSTRGDWVETVAGAPDQNMAQRMQEFIRLYGRDTVASLSRGWGKALVVNVFLWDCAEHFSGGAWTLQDESADCSQFDVDPKVASDYRVHVFSVVPLTFYEGLIRTQGRVTIDAFWGNAFGDAGVCQSIPPPTTPQCQLNPLMNSAFLVPDE